MLLAKHPYHCHLFYKMPPLLSSFSCLLNGHADRPDTPASQHDGRGDENTYFLVLPQYSDCNNFASN